MNRYWMIPTGASFLLAAIMAVSITRESTAQVDAYPPQESKTPPAKTVWGGAEFENGLTIKELRISDPRAEDGHMELQIDAGGTPDSINGYFVAVHLNNKDGSILTKLGDFAMAGQMVQPSLDGLIVYKFAIPRFTRQEGQTLGIAIYNDPKQLVRVKSEQTDWDFHRALFPLNQIPSQPSK